MSIFKDTINVSPDLVYAKHHAQCNNTRAE